MVSQDILIINRLGLHARAAAQLVRPAGGRVGGGRPEGGRRGGAAGGAGREEGLERPAAGGAAGGRDRGL